MATAAVCIHCHCCLVWESMRIKKKKNHLPKVANPILPLARVTVLYKISTVLCPNMFSVNSSDVPAFGPFRLPPSSGSSLQSPSLDHLLFKAHPGRCVSSSLVPALGPSSQNLEHLHSTAQGLRNSHGRQTCVSRRWHQARHEVREMQWRNGKGVH